MSVLMREFDSVCATNGDDTAFYTSYCRSDDLENQEAASAAGVPNLNTVGFSELNENINLIASELFHRHSIRPPQMPDSDGIVPPKSSPSGQPTTHVTEAFMKEARSRCVLIVSDQPSPGEAAAVMACVRLHTTFIPLALSGPHRTNDSRVRVILQENPPLAVIAILSVPDIDASSENNEDDWEKKPALLSNEFDADSHPTVMRLSRLGVHRIINVNAKDGSVVGSMAGVATGENEFNLPSVNIEDDGKDPMYILYTSGSTSKPKAVLQTYSGLWNRICWQWKTFPFVQQMRRTLGFKETLKHLADDGIISRDLDVDQTSLEINDVVLRRTSLSFVDSMAEIFGTLLGGASLFCPLIIDDTNRRERPSLGLATMLDIASHDGVRVTRMTCLPSQLDQAFRHYEEKGEDDWTTTLDLIIVSGESCSRSLPLMFDQKMKKEKPLLVNLYGQTESSGDVSCLVAATGNVTKPLSRFPEAMKYIWKEPPLDESSSVNFVQKCSQSLIPCGLPIDGHKFFIKPVTMKSGLSNQGVGCLFVSGPGIALGYSNNYQEILDNFTTSKAEGKNDGRIDSILFNTRDIAFEDSDGFMFIVGRVPKKEEDVVGVDDIGCSLTIGKLNGVMVHVASIEDAFLESMREVLLHNHLGNESPYATAILHSECSTGMNKSALFINLSTFPPDSIIVKNASTRSGSIIEASDVVFKTSGMKFQDVLIETRSKILQDNHPSLVPHKILLLPSMPTNGAAGKVNRSLLAKCVTDYTKAMPNTKDCQSKEDDLLLDTIILVFSSILGLEKEEIRERTDVTFPELGGDSMMAINAAYKINTSIHDKVSIVIDYHRISSLDVMQLTIQVLYEIAKNGRASLTPEAKKPRLLKDYHDTNDSLAAIASCPTLFKDTYIAQNESFAYVSKIWKIAMSMCVDSKPIIVKNRNDTLIISGSQGRDLACITLDGKILSRKKVLGKIEGDLSHLPSNSQAFADPIIYVPTYAVSRDKDGSKSTPCGHVHALKLSKTNSFEILWSYSTSGEIKGSPVIFTHDFRQSAKDTISSRILLASYDGSLSYLDAVTGVLLHKVENLGGAIHADPIILKHDNTVSVIVASCTWKGKVTCLILAKDAMEVTWEVDLWTPIYATPYAISSEIKGVCSNISSVVICAIDGSVRSLEFQTGDEIWKNVQIGSKPIFTQCCSLETSVGMRGMIIFGSNDGKLRCINKFTGNIQWTIDVFSPMLSSPICTQSHIVCATAAGSMVIFDKNAILGESQKSMIGKDKTKKEEEAPPCLVIPDGMKTSISLDGEIFCNSVALGNDVYIGCRDSCLYKLGLHIHN